MAFRKATICSQISLHTVPPLSTLLRPAGIVGQNGRHPAAGTSHSTGYATL